jgi:chemotaxis protein methyltransferase CheR
VTRTISEPLLGQLSDFVADRLGLSFPQERWADLERGILSAAPDLSFPSSEPFIQQLLSMSLSRSQIEILASHLTVGETLLYRDSKDFEALEERVLPEMIRAREKAENTRDEIVPASDGMAAARLREIVEPTLECK